MKYKFHAKQGVLECYVYSIKNSEIEKKLQEQRKNEELGISSSDEEEKIYGEPIEIVIDLTTNGGVAFFTPNKVELFEEANFVEGVHVEFENGSDFVFLMGHKDFKNIYYEYKGIDNGS